MNSVLSVSDSDSNLCVTNSELCHIDAGKYAFHFSMLRRGSLAILKPDRLLFAILSVVANF